MRPRVLPRRAAFGLGAMAVLAGCGVLARPAYLRRTIWPITVRHPPALRPRVGGKVLEVRSLTAAPGLDQLGVEWLRPDGSLHVDFYQQWAVPPAEGATDALRRWLAASGRFAAVVGPDNGVPADLVLQGELTAFLADPAQGVAEVALAVVLIGRRPAGSVLTQRTVTARAPLHGSGPVPIVHATLRALAEVLAGVERLTAAA